MARVRKWSAGNGGAIAVSEERGVRMLHIGGDAIQSAMRLSAPDALELEYTREMLACLLWRDWALWPRSVLLIGLGAGSLSAFAESGGAYLALIGGTAALETTWIERIEDVDLDDLNPESLWKFRVSGFGPLLVAMDSVGGNLYREVDAEARAQRAAVLASLGVK